MYRRLLGACFVVLSPLVAVSTWWLVGDISEPGLASLDYFVEPPAISARSETALGWVASIAAIATAAIVEHGGRTAAITRRRSTAAIPMIAIGVFVGFTFRVVTAGVSGANIGAGLLMMGSTVFIPVMIAVASLLWRDDRPARRT